MSKKPNPGGLYILDDDHNPVPEPDTLKWAKWMDLANTFNDRIVKQEFVGPKGSQYFISTVFLGIDHNFDFLGENSSRLPILFETMVFKPTADSNTGGGADIDCRRYATWAGALLGHADIVRKYEELAQAELVFING